MILKTCLLSHLFSRIQLLISWHILCKSQSQISARDNGDFQQGICVPQHPPNNGMTRFMVSHHSFLCWWHDMASLLCTTNYTLHSIFQVISTHCCLFVTSSMQGSFITDVSYISTCEEDGMGNFNEAVGNYRGRTYAFWFKNKLMCKTKHGINKYSRIRHCLYAELYLELVHSTSIFTWMVNIKLAISIWFWGQCLDLSEGK